MTKNDAIRLFGTVAGMARILGVTRQAIYQWPAVLTQEQSDRVTGAALRVGRLPAAVESAEAPHTSEAQAVPTPGDGYRPVGAPADAPPPCDEAGRERVA